MVCNACLQFFRWAGTNLIWIWHPDRYLCDLLREFAVIESDTLLRTHTLVRERHMGLRPVCWFVERRWVRSVAQRDALLLKRGCRRVLALEATAFYSLEAASSTAPGPR